MYVVAECLTCAVLTSTLSAFLFAFCVLFLTIKQGIGSRRYTSRELQKVGNLFGPRLAMVVARHKTSGR